MQKLDGDNPSPAKRTRTINKKNPAIFERGDLNFSFLFWEFICGAAS